MKKLNLKLGGIKEMLTREQMKKVVGVVVIAPELSINAFPTNFLLDSRGIVIKKNIAPAGLEQFLLENIK